MASIIDTDTSHYQIGTPIPPDTHAVSVSLPTWEAVCGYEEGDPRITSQLITGYPRFRIHTYHTMITTKLLSDFNDPTFSCMIFPSFEVAKRVENFLQVIFSFQKFKHLFREYLKIIV